MDRVNAEGRAAVANSTGHGSFHLGDRTEVVTNANTRISEVIAEVDRLLPGPTAPPRGRRPDRTRANSRPAPQNCGASKRDERGKLRVCVGRLHTHSTAHHLENTYCFQRHRYEVRGGVVGPHRRAHQLHLP